MRTTWDKALLDCGPRIEGHAAPELPDMRLRDCSEQPHCQPAFQLGNGQVLSKLQARFALLTEEWLARFLWDALGFRPGWLLRAVDLATVIGARRPVQPGVRSPLSAVNHAKWTDMDLHGVDFQRNQLKSAPARGCSTTTGLPNLADFSCGLPLHKNTLGGYRTGDRLVL